MDHELTLSLSVLIIDIVGRGTQDTRISRQHRRVLTHSLWSLRRHTGGDRAKIKLCRSALKLQSHNLSLTPGQVVFVLKHNLNLQKCKVSTYPWCKNLHWQHLFCRGFARYLYVRLSLWTDFVNNSVTPRFHQIHPLDIMLHYVSATPAVCLNVLTSSRSGALRIRSAPAQAVRRPLAGLLFLAEAAIQLKFAPSRQEVKHQNNNITSGYFSK